MSVLASARNVGLERERDVPRLRAVPSREDEIVALRHAGHTLAQIGEQYGLSRQRVAQIIDRVGRVPAADVWDVRRARDARRPVERAGEVLERFRQGSPPLEISRELGLPVREVRRAIAERASDEDRQARKRALSHSRPVPAARFFDEDLLAGVRQVTELIGHPPTGPQYAQLAGDLGLASAKTVESRFGGWVRALRAAGLQPQLAPVRTHVPRWHLAACWNALVSVADQLGDPPRYRRYLELASHRDDLPSAATVRVRLGLWSEIAAALQTRNGANGARSAAAPGSKGAAAARNRAGARRNGAAPGSDGAVQWNNGARA